MDLSQLKDHNEQFFSKGNKKLFNDRSYRILKGKKSKDYFFIQESAMVFGDCSDLPSYFIVKDIKNKRIGKRISIEYSLKEVHEKMKSL
tara:strand:+ start:694 stop:960 length:267 start_codon:yes stop_codon:yes gene_type:complete